jgi:hypothetical protein
VTRADVVAIALSLMLLGGLFAICWQPAQAAAWVEIRTGDRLVGRYPLAEDRELSVRGRLGDSHVRIEHGRVRFIDSPCRNRICVLGGWLSRSGDEAACLPNGVSIALGGGGDPVDAVSQ